MWAFILNDTSYEMEGIILNWVELIGVKQVTHNIEQENFWNVIDKKEQREYILILKSTT